MSTMEFETFRTIERGIRRKLEREMIAGIKVIRLELELLAKQDLIEELEASEGARLEPVEEPGPAARRGLGGARPASRTDATGGGA